MRRRLLLPMLMVIAAALAFSQAQAAKPEWKEYSYPEDGFALTAPSQPAFQKQQQATAAGNVEMRQYSVDLESDSGVMMSVSDFPNAENADPKTALEGAVNGSIQATKAKKISQKEIALQQVPGIEFEAESEAYHMLGRYYWSKGRLLSLLAVAPINTPMPADAVRVLDSLKLITK